MTLSRTSRILLGFLLLILAAFLWVNFLARDSGFNLPFLSAAPAPSPQGAAGAQETPAVAPVPDSDAGREIDVLDLPFLVPEPPEEEEQPESGPAADAQAAAPAQDARRATINPFSPIVQRGGAQAGPGAARQTGPQQPRTVTEVPVPAGPQRGAPATQAQAPRAPAPQAVTPGGTATGTLPRALPGGTLGGTPGLLRSAIGATDAPEQDLGRVAAVREPEESQADLQAGADGDRQPRPLAQPIDPQVEAGRRSQIPDQAPLAAGTSTLSRYLRNNNVRFTGSVIGPVSVGVFRSSQTSAPIVISLGQTLPDTSIVLTDLRGQQAELMLGDTTQILTLELRR